MAGTTEIGKSTPSPDETGARRRGRYVLGDLLGRGGMAEVFAGRSLGSHGFQKPVAIKRLLPELAKDEVFVTRLIGEAKLLVGMQHGNIVSVLDLSREGDDVFLVMEFVDGPSLRQLIKARAAKGLSLAISTYIVQSAAAGLEFAHARPGGAIIHADISPSNLLLTSSGEVRVADFGIARREGRMDGLIEGKWAYMAPEQARGESLTPASDVFALGVVLYELITGRHPLGKNVTADERERMPVRVVPPRIVRPAVPAGLDAICLKALAHDPRDRFQCMQDLIDALVEQRFANGWREGAKDLAEVIRESVPATELVEPRTASTDRPLTILTRSLITDPSASSMSMPSAPRTATGTQPGRQATTQATGAAIGPIGLPPPMPLPGLPPAAQLAPFVPAAMMAPATPATGHVPASRGTASVLVIAAVIGTAAAIAVSLAPNDASKKLAAPPVVASAAGEAAGLGPRASGLGPAPVGSAAASVAAPQPQPVVQPQPQPQSQPAPLPPVVHAAPRPHLVAAAEPPAHRHHATPVAHAGRDATLRVLTYGGTWADVVVTDEHHAEVGSADNRHATFRLPAGAYTIRLHHEDMPGRSCVVKLEPGAMLTLKVDMQGGACDHY